MRSLFIYHSIAKCFRHNKKSECRILRRRGILPVEVIGVAVAQVVERVGSWWQGCWFDPWLLLAVCWGVPEQGTAPDELADAAVGVWMCGWLWGNIVKRFVCPLVTKNVLYKCSPFTIRWFIFILFALWERVSECLCVWDNSNCSVLKTSLAVFRPARTELVPVRAPVPLGTKVLTGERPAFKPLKVNPWCVNDRGCGQKQGHTKAENNNHTQRQPS